MPAAKKATATKKVSAKKSAALPAALKAPTSRATAVSALKLMMTFERDTKGTHVFSGVDDAPIKSLYINKGAFPEGATPQQITITIDY